MSNLVVIKTFMHRHEAEMAQAFLSGRGIDSVIHADDCGGMRPHLSLVMNGVQLLVNEVDREKADEALGK